MPAVTPARVPAPDLGRRSRAASGRTGHPGSADLARAGLALLLALLVLVPLLPGCQAAKPTASAPPVQAPAPKTEAEASRSVLGFGDELSVAVWRHDDLRTSARVDDAGGISLPLVGTVQAAGKTAGELRDELTARYAAFVVSPQVMVNVTQVRSQTALVLGEVKTQGAQIVDHDISFFEAVAKAGGFTDDAGRGAVLLLRQSGPTPKVYVLDLTLGEKTGQGTQGGFVRYLRGGDILYAPKSTVASVETFLRHLNNILQPLISLERLVIFMPQLRDAVEDLARGGPEEVTINQPVAGEVLSNQGGGVFTVD